MKSVWVTYSWKDNQEGDIDYIAQEIRKCGIDVKLDKWNIKAGKRLWEQIDNYISNEKETDAWIFIASSNSLGSEKCQEEYYYALERALEKRGSNFPLITIFLSQVDKSLLPSGIKIRLYLSIYDRNWKEKVISSIKGKKIKIRRKDIDPYYIIIHNFTRGDVDGYSIELRPRAGVWYPFFAAIKYDEKESLNPVLRTGPKNIPPRGGVEINCGDFLSDDKKLWIMVIENEVSPTRSGFLFVNDIPSELIFGSDENRYSVVIKPK